MYIFYYFLKRNLTDEVSKIPFVSNDYLGDISDFVSIDGVGYTIVDYAVEWEG